MAVRMTAAGLLAGSGVAAASEPLTRQAEITNVTPRQTFTPILTAMHHGSADMFEPGAIVEIRRVHGGR